MKYLILILTVFCLYSCEVDYVQHIERPLSIDQWVYESNSYPYMDSIETIMAQYDRKAIANDMYSAGR
jgi:hypothetical protein